MARFEAQVDSYGKLRKKLAALAKIDRIGPWMREDRTSKRLGLTRLEADQIYTVDLLLLPLEDDIQNPQALRAVEEYVSSQGGQMVDRAVEPSFTAVRVRMGGQSLESLLEYRDDIALADLPPKANVLVPEVLGLSLEAVPEVGSPPSTSPAVCVADSGIVEAHPLLEPAVLSELSRSFPAVLGPPVPKAPVGEAGHGTNVAAVALYGDVGACAVTKSFVPNLWLVNARVLDDNNGFHPDRMPFLRAVVEHARARCRVFNLSYGLEQCEGYLSPQAAELDELTREFGVLFVVSAGNMHPGRTASDAAAAVADYPECLKGDPRRVLAPAEALTALTVGAITPDRDPSYPQRTAAAPKRAPAPFTLAGGIKGVVKPELVEVGGNLAYEGSPARWVSNDPALGVATASHRFSEGQLLTFTRGTSVAAPRVSHLAARIVERYPDASSNLLRALLVNSAVCPEGVVSWDKKDILALCGFGVPDPDRALYCRPNRVTLYHDGVIKVDDVNIFEVPVPHELARARGRKAVTVTLAYDPPVSLVHRERPAGVHLAWGLARGDVREEVLQAAIAAQAEGEAADTSEPAISQRQRPVFMTGELPKRAQRRGAVQKNAFSWSRGEHGDTYRLVITARATRRRHASDSQRFAIAVTLECEDASVNVYNAVRTRVGAGRARIRIPGR